MPIETEKVSIKIYYIEAADGRTSSREEVDLKTI